MGKETDYTEYKPGVTVEADESSPTGYLATFVYEQQDSYEGLGGSIADVQLYSDGMMLFDPAGGEVGSISMDLAQDPWKYRAGLVNAGGSADVAYFVHMTKFADRLWGIQIPLPSGAKTYNFYITDESGKTLSRQSDPNNPSMVNKATGQHGPSSVVCIPYCAAKMGSGELADRSAEDPCADQEMKGKVEYLSYDSDRYGKGRGLAVYLPAAYDAERKEPFNVLYLSHGTSAEKYGNELRWLHEGALVNITDNLIAAEKADPFIVVCMNNQDLLAVDGVEWDYKAIEYEQFSHIMPLIEKTYNVCKEPAGRAYAGLSRGGIVTQRMLEDHGDEFSYYGIWSYAFDINKDALSKLTHPVNILLNAGKWDFGNSHIKAYCDGLESLGLPFTYVEYPAAHDWEDWKLIYAHALRTFFWK